MKFLSLGFFGGEITSTRWPLTYAVFDFFGFFESREFSDFKEKKQKKPLTNGDFAGGRGGYGITTPPPPPPEPGDNRDANSRLPSVLP